MLIIIKKNKTTTTGENPSSRNLELLLIKRSETDFSSLCKSSVWSHVNTIQNGFVSQFRNGNSFCPTAVGEVLDWPSPWWSRPGVVEWWSSRAEGRPLDRCWTRSPSEPSRQNPTDLWLGVKNTWERIAASVSLHCEKSELKHNISRVSHGTKGM